MAARHAEGDVTLAFIVGRDGGVIPGTERVISATGSEFAVAALYSLNGARLGVATVGGCPVNLYRVWPFDFRMPSGG
jgi:hypothetical protein